LDQGTASEVAEKLDLSMILSEGHSFSCAVSACKITLPRCRRLARSEAQRTEQSFFHSLFSLAEKAVQNPGFSPCGQPASTAKYFEIFLQLEPLALFPSDIKVIHSTAISCIITQAFQNAPSWAIL
jgi:hypothetical protein